MTLGEWCWGADHAGAAQSTVPQPVIGLVCRNAQAWARWGSAAQDAVQDAVQDAAGSGVCVCADHDAFAPVIPVSRRGAAASLKRLLRDGQAWWRAAGEAGAEQQHWLTLR